MAEIGGGNVAIFIDGHERFLVPTLEACIELSGIAGGLNEIVRRINALHFETICAVIGAGLSLNPTQRKQMLPKAVFEAGLLNITPACIDFVHIVANGGMPFSDEPEAAKETDPLAPSDTANITTA